MDSNDNNVNLLDSGVNHHDQTINGVPEHLYKSHFSPYSTESNVPSRFKESSFRRFESVLEKYVLRYPEPLFVRPQGLSLETFSCRLRDAVKALGKNRTWNLRLSDQLQSMWPTTVVAYHDGQVRIGPREQKQQKGSFEVVKNALASTHTTNEIVLPNSLLVLDRVCQLLAALDGQMQVRFKGTNLDEFTSYLNQHSNVEAFQDGEDVVLL